MPTNVPPQYYEAETRFRKAKTTEEKIAILEEMMILMPKHKGTDKLRVTLNQKLKKLKEGEDEKKGGKRQTVSVPREGAAQVTLIGAPNVGKSQLITSMTKATPEVAAYPFTTRMPVPGMVVFEDVQIQLIELPAITESSMEVWVPEIIRGSDLLLIMLDLASSDLLDCIDPIIRQLEKHHIFLVKEIPPEEEQKVSVGYMRTMLLGNKVDHPDASANLELFQEWLKNRFYFFGCVSAQDPSTLTLFAKNLFDALKIIRVYTKAPGRKFDKIDPVILPAGATMVDAAKTLHKEIAEKFKFARVWGDGVHDGQQVAKDHILKDGWVLEFHT